jgi:hypothetical protein
MACSACKDLKDITDLRTLYVVRACKKCGRKIKLRQLGKHGMGVKIEKGDQIVMPAGALQFSANPLKGGGRFTTRGLSWFAKMVFGVEIGNQKSRDNFAQALADIIEANEQNFVGVDFLGDLDLEDPENEA